MPLHDYRCTACGREVEVLRGIHEPGPSACATCGGAMSKVFSPPAIHFKGSGWAKKDAASRARTAPRTEAASDSADDTAKPAQGSKGSDGPSKEAQSTADGGATSTATTSD